MEILRKFIQLTNTNPEIKQSDKTIVYEETDVKEEDDPTIPANNKETQKIIESEQEKSDAKTKNESRKPAEKPLQELTETNNEIKKLKTNIANSYADIITRLEALTNKYNEITNKMEAFESRHDLIIDIASDLQTNANDISTNVTLIKELIAVNKLLANRIDNLKLKWELTFQPITPEEISGQMNDNNKYKAEWTDLNNIISKIYELKVKVTNELIKEQEKPTEEKYQEIYRIALLMNRIFNVYPPKLKYFTRKIKGEKLNQEGTPEYEETIDWENMQITENEAKLIDISECQTHDELNQILKKLGMGKNET